jgi:hypothetical protein
MTPKIGPAIRFGVPLSRLPRKTKPVVGPISSGFERFEIARMPKRIAATVRKGPRSRAWAVALAKVRREEKGRVRASVEPHVLRDHDHAPVAHGEATPVGLEVVADLQAGGDADPLVDDARRMRAWRPTSTSSKRIDSATSEKLFTRTRRPRIERSTRPPLMMQPSDTIESVAMPTRFDSRSANTNLAGGFGKNAE